jgi:hypothetical protein
MQKNRIAANAWFRVLAETRLFTARSDSKARTWSDPGSAGCRVP